MEADQRTHSASGLTLIAEAATCHGGSVPLALLMVEAGAAVGATHVKFQHVDSGYFPRGSSEREWYERCRFSIADWLQVKTQCSLCGVEFLCTPQTVSDFEDLLAVGIESVKISSDNVVNEPLLDAVNRWGGRAYLSSGGASEAQMREAIRRLKQTELHIMVCTSEYPCPPEHANLVRLYQSGVKGFSDHTEGNDAALVALGLGARIFEKHFRLAAESHGPDADFCGDEYDLREYFEALKRGMTMLGDGKWRAE